MRSATHQDAVGGMSEHCRASADSYILPDVRVAAVRYARTADHSAGSAHP
jgi:hypothetical protein